MYEKPILFSGEMVRAILCGLKTQTRRVVKHIPILGEPKHWCDMLKNDPTKFFHIAGDFRQYCPYNAKNLWVRESFALCSGFDSMPPSQSGDESIWWKASMPILPTGYAACHGKWRPSIHMPRWASRFTLNVKNIHIERLQEITDKDALKEGVDRTNTSIPGYAKTRFQKLWDSINKNRGYGWDTNPWVWVITFERK